MVCYLLQSLRTQAILESGWGGSRLSTLANNLFGIKGNYNGASISMPTQEYINGRWITINDNFRKYPSRNASVEDHGRFLNDNSRYHNLLWQTDYRKVTRLLQNDGYATAPTYTASLNRIIEQYHLNDWDNERVVQKSLVKMVGKVNGGQPMYLVTKYWYAAVRI
ncbi:glycoside hydrolase family 73 protein [Latilactobacillus sakei]|uniref:glycoside hydrolase family 73 protein n=1 Tax=Latilactobacillus sakei TaxID=1599 RepID=UPI001EF8AA77|nr:glycoside hydrolase family 73 protein [Latilactobacillus sakei]